MRLDRTMSLYAFRPIMEMNGVSRRRVLPILMYHSISDDAEPDCSPYYKTATSPARFAQHLRWLNEEGFRSVDLEEGLRLAQTESPRERMVVITFDDGFRDFYCSAFPELKAHDHAATVFLPTDFIGQNRRSFKNRDCLTWREVRELRAQGVRFGSHTASHPVLHECLRAKIENELSVSRQELEQELGERITGFAYPYAFPQADRRFAAQFRNILREQGYRYCVTTMIGRFQSGDDLFSLKRLPVNNCDDRTLFLAKLKGAYDGMGCLQSWSKLIRYQWRRFFQNVSATPSVERSPKAL